MIELKSWFVKKVLKLIILCLLEKYSPYVFRTFMTHMRLRTLLKKYEPFRIT